MGGLPDLESGKAPTPLQQIYCSLSVLKEQVCAPVLVTEGSATAKQGVIAGASRIHEDCTCVPGGCKTRAEDGVEAVDVETHGGDKRTITMSVVKRSPCSISWIRWKLCAAQVKTGRAALFAALHICNQRPSNEHCAANCSKRSCSMSSSSSSSGLSSMGGYRSSSSSSASGTKSGRRSYSPHLRAPI